MNTTDENPRPLMERLEGLAKLIPTCEEAVTYIRDRISHDNEESLGETKTSELISELRERGILRRLSVTDRVADVLVPHQQEERIRRRQARMLADSLFEYKAIYQDTRQVDDWVDFVASVDVLAPPNGNDAHVDWAVSRWEAEVKYRPLQNINRRALDDTWRQVIRHFGGDPKALCGPAHDDLV